MKYDHKTIVFAITLIFCQAAAARSNGVDRYIETQTRNLHIPGISLAVVRDGRIIKAKGYGLSNIETNSAATPQTVYEIGSMTKHIQNHVAVPGYSDIFKTSITLKDFPSRDELLKEFLKLPSEFQPGETWAYDNTGYYLLGIIAEKASGKRFLAVSGRAHI